jgi:hypothetical protein
MRAGRGWTLAMTVGLVAGSAEAKWPAVETPKTAPQTISRTASPVIVDGALDEAAWQKAWTMDLKYEVSPRENVPAPVRTEILVTYDDEAVYFGFRAFDPEPAKIRAHLYDRDNVGADDWVAVILDTFNDERRSFDLLVNPLGVQSDSIETATSNEEWDGIWEAAARITEWGYAVEIRLPFSSVRFQRPNGGPQVWGFDAVRSYPRNVRHHIGLFARDRNNNCYLCQAVKLSGFEGVTPGRNLELDPTLTGTRTDTRSELPDGAMENGDADAELGITARWGITPDVTLQGTVNPDFSQVEADALQLDVNEPFALSYPEKRPFFMEGADFFRTRLNTVYTRVVRDPAWGVKLSGKSDGTTVGAWVARDEITNLLLPGTQSSNGTTLDSDSTAAVLRYKRDLGNRLTLGALATDREGADYHNRVLGFDGDFRVSDKDRLGLQLLGSATQYPGAVATDFGLPEDELRDWAGEIGYERTSRHVDAWATYRRVGKDFRADLGFIPQVGYGMADAGAGYSWIPKPKSWFSYLRLAVGVTDSEAEGNGMLYREGKLRLEYEGPLQSHAYIRLIQRREAYNGSEFDKSMLELHTCLKPGGDTQVYLNAMLGDQIDYANTRLGQRVRVGPGITQQVGRHLSVDLSATWERMREQDDRLYTATIAQATIGYQFTTRALLRAIVQWMDYDYNTALYTDGRDARQQGLFTQILASYKINPQTVLFLGYSDAAEGTQDYDLTRSSRTVFAKIGYAWLP